MKSPIYRQKYDILKFVENSAYLNAALLNIALGLFIVVGLSYLFGWYGDTGKTLLGQLLSLIQ